MLGARGRSLSSRTSRSAELEAGREGFPARKSMDLQRTASVSGLSTFRRLVSDREDGEEDKGAKGPGAEVPQAMGSHKSLSLWIEAIDVASAEMMQAESILQSRHSSVDAGSMNDRGSFDSLESVSSAGSFRSAKSQGSLRRMPTCPRCESVFENVDGEHNKAPPTIQRPSRPARVAALNASLALMRTWNGYKPQHRRVYLQHPELLNEELRAADARLARGCGARRASDPRRSGALLEDLEKIRTGDTHIRLLSTV
mmetsp:Transcript_28022/g.69320  ORF Transcript_28022/g.69320 Transcript_28022/m.69320 type:complete len:256 (-) Transcript_28022:224-991(-)